MGEVVVITGGSAGVGRALARHFAARGYAVGLIARDAERLAEAVAELRQHGAEAVGFPADVADADAMETAAGGIENALGPISIWINNAMATMFAPISETEAREFARATEVTYLGTVHGTMAALRRMRPRRAGTIMNVNSALGYRGIPLQAAYCGAKFAIRGFSESLRAELAHDGMPIRVCLAFLPAVNTPQFDWARNRTGHKVRPVPPVFQPESIAARIAEATIAGEDETWIGLPTWKAIIGNLLAPHLLDRYLARSGYRGQITDAAEDAPHPGNLFDPVRTEVAAHGRFDDQASRRVSAITSRQRTAMVAVSATLGGLAMLTLLGRRRS